MAAYTINDWLIFLLVFVLGLIVGMFLLAGSKWKRRYREEVKHREAAEKERDERIRELEAENESLRRDLREMQSLRGAADRAPARHPDHDRGPI
ncbi:MAG: hypothetical protein ACK4K7_05530 [Allosphingosinicella sp.]|uniref:hypothetical protein n=1 Tax=Allosphingosinicella sp. TaxID=2823234 RepID=UPI0039609742